MPRIEEALKYAKNHHNALLERLKTLLAIPSISTLAESAADVRRSAEWLAGELGRIGMKRVQVMDTAGHPMVCGESDLQPGLPTALVYGHYDVQPADPLEEWHTGPFEPTLRGENLYARGASDMKGSLSAFLLQSG